MRLLPDLEKIVRDYAREPPLPMKLCHAAIKSYQNKVTVWGSALTSMEMPELVDLIDGFWDAHRVIFTCVDSHDIACLCRLKAHFCPEYYPQHDLLNFEFKYLMRYPDSITNQLTLSNAVFNHWGEILNEIVSS